jgi:hypothetical protein
MIRKILIRDARHFANLKKRFWKNTADKRFCFGKPDHYPCIAIEITPVVVEGRVMVEDFVYVSDFNEGAKPLGRD